MAEHTITYNSYKFATDPILTSFDFTQKQELQAAEDVTIQVDALLSSTTPAGLKTKIDTFIAAIEVVNKPIKYEIDSAVVWEYDNSGPSPDSGYVTTRFGMPKYDARGVSCRISVTFDYTLSMGGAGGKSSMRGHIRISYGYDRQDRRNANYDYRFKFDSDTYATAEEQALAWLDDNFTLAKNYVRGPISIDMETSTEPDGTPILSPYRWVHWTWNEHEQEIPYYPSDTSGAEESELCDYQISYTENRESGNAITDKYVRTVTGSFTVRKDARDAPQEFTDFMEESQGADLGYYAPLLDQIISDIVKKFLPGGWWLLTQSKTWDVPGISGNFRIQALRGEGYGTDPRITSFTQASLTVSSSPVVPLNEVELTDGITELEKTGQRYQMVTVNGAFARLGKPIKFVEPVGWEDTNVRLISFNPNDVHPQFTQNTSPSLNKEYSAGFSAQFKIKGSGTISWEPLLSAIIVLPRKHFPAVQ